MIDKISKLLALAEGAATPEEAELAMSRAQHIASLHSIDIAKLRAATPAAKRTTPIIKHVKIGAYRKHSNAQMIELMWAIARHNCVRMTMMMDNTAATLYGMEDDIEMVEQMYASLAIQMVRASERYLATDAWRDERMWDERNYEYRPMTKQSARKSFYAGFTTAIDNRLHTAAKAAEAEAREAEASVTPGAASLSTEIVLRDKKKEVDDFFSKSTGRLRSWGGASRGASSHARSAGHRSGSSASLGNASGIGSGRNALTR